MRYFQGYLRSYADEGRQLVLRLFAGTIDLEPDDHPVVVVVVHEPLAKDACVADLKLLEEENAWLYLTQPEESVLSIESENGTEVQLRGQKVEIDSQPYGEAEWEWLARSSQEHANHLNSSLVEARSRLNRVLELVAEQQARIAVKAQGHELGTTARTLYEQHAQLLARIRAAAEA